MSVAPLRPLKGSRISTFYPIKSIPPLSTLDSAFQLQEFISLTIRLNIHDVSAIISIPDSRNNTEGISDDNINDEADFAVDTACWIYEQLRRLAQDLSHPLITMLQQECTRATCPEMKAGEWMYLCVAHGNEGAMEQCCAIDYILHTVDSATALLNSPRAFPSRINIPSPSHRHFNSLARRLGRIFAHAYFHHREVFEQAEAESSLYARFLALTCKFDLDDSDDRGRGVHRGLGRNRTGTMIFSKDGHSPSPERESMAQMSGASSGIHESDGEEEEHSAEEHDGYMGPLTEEDHHVTGTPDIHTYPDADVTDDAEMESDTLAEALGEPVDEDDPEHDVTSAHGAASDEMIDALEEDAQEEEEDLTEAVVEAHDDDADAVDAREDEAADAV
ncbi:Mob1/phocein [Lactifluus volemus]|nr:Mob1/phocein [Lactifluus volemus]